MSKHVAETDDTYVKTDGKFRLIVSRAWSMGHGYHTNRYRYVVTMASSDPAVGRVNVAHGEYYSPGDDEHAKRTMIEVGTRAMRHAVEVWK
ncbi:hypothetical protein EniyanLRS_154 [Mycobacterium phage EniyanLRS]|nr:hypothetical protein EniyanLRS_154 [Mycobacterium phage EniyanLRS]QGJ90019.1 hypothetical protein PBI_MARYV_147 [Mycobacterium phage MaryV]